MKVDIPISYAEVSRAQRANKAPEPTTTSVTPRAMLRLSEMKQQTENRIEARVVPAVVVAHL